MCSCDLLLVNVVESLGTSGISISKSISPKLEAESGPG